ncbi:MAG: hypothetical protein K940chlam8_00145 [Chlamydiae bacterium]|nr:hypothetical protein [Chlamydiota bacterium]
MKEEKILRQFDELLKHSKDTDVLHLEETVHELIKIFMQIKDQLESDDLEVRKEAVKNLNLLQKKLKEQADFAVKETGLSQDELKEYMNTSKNFSEDEWKAIQEAQKELKDYEKQLVQPSSSPVKQEKKDKKGKKGPPKSKWITG